MKRIFLGLVCLMSINTICVSQRVDSLEELKQQIRELEKIERDDNISFDVKQMNASFLDDRRASLRKTLETRISSAKQYLLRVGSQLSNAEIQEVEQNLATWQKELAMQSERSSEARETSPGQSTSQPVAMRIEASAATMPANAAAPPPQSQVQPVRSTPKPLPGEAAALIREPVAEIVNPAAARGFITEALRKKLLKDSDGNDLPETVVDNKDFHCVIHVLRWSGVTNNEKTKRAEQTVVAQNWYVYNNGNAKGLRSDRIWSQEDFTTQDRIYGVKKVWLLYVHLNRMGVLYDAYYDFNFTKKTPANVSNVIALGQIFIAFTGTGPSADATVFENVWGGGLAETNYVPSDVTVTAKILRKTDDTYVALDKPKKFDNEGLYWWDVSIGVPIRRIKELQFDSTANTVTQKEVDKQNAFALLNFYFPPKDLKGTNASWIPHFVGGVAIAKQPLKKFLLGAGFGPNFTNFYVGALFTEEKKPATLAEGSTATPDQLNNDLKKNFKAQFTFGINVPIRAVLATLDKKKE